MYVSYTHTYTRAETRGSGKEGVGKKWNARMRSVYAQRSGEQTGEGGGARYPYRSRHYGLLPRENSGM